MDGLNNDGYVFYDEAGEVSPEAWKQLEMKREEEKQLVKFYWNSMFMTRLTIRECIDLIKFLSLTTRGRG